MESVAQQDLFGAPAGGVEIVRAAVPDEQVVQVARRLPKNLHFGTSSQVVSRTCSSVRSTLLALRWKLVERSFPGWVGLVYAELYSASTLARHGLGAYARHPLLNAVNVDSTFYKVQTTEQLAAYAAKVPEAFRFMVKAYAGLTTVPDSPLAIRRRVDPVFLDARFAARSVITPLMDALGPRLGALLFQFPPLVRTQSAQRRSGAKPRGLARAMHASHPLGSAYTREPRHFIARLGEFLCALPSGPTYAVELRDPELLRSEYEAALRAAGAVHCSNVHSRMPPVDQQVRSSSGKSPLLIRWMLQAGDDYESAGARFAPFDRLREPDKLNRDRIAAMVGAGLSSGRDVHVIAANNAEGSAPLTLYELAKTIVTN